MATYHEAGSYMATIAAAGWTRSAQTQTEQVVISLKLDAFIAQNGQAYEMQDTGGFPPEVYLALTPATMGTPEQPGWVVETLKSLGFNGDFLNLGKLAGKKVRCQCKHEPSQNDPSEMREVWSIFRSTKPRHASVPAADARRLSSQWGRLFREPPPAKAINLQPPGRAAEPAQSSDDDESADHPSPADDLDEIPY